jgi:hypothetical protein
LAHVTGGQGGGAERGGGERGFSPQARGDQVYVNALERNYRKFNRKCMRQESKIAKNFFFLKKNK